MADKVETKGMGFEDKRLKRKQSLEASVTLGLGHGKKKKLHVEAFYSALWPVLKNGGWTLVKGEGNEEGAKYFLPPGVTMVSKGKGEDEEAAPQGLSKAAPRDDGPWDCASCGHTNASAKSRCTRAVGEGKCMAWRGGKRLRKSYFSKVRDVIEKVLLGKENAVEAKAADAYVELVPDASHMFMDKKDKKGESPSLHSQEVSTNQFAWKDERTHYEKSSSRVGPEFQVDVLPTAGSYAPDNSDVYDGGAMYERVWDLDKAENSGKLDFIHTRVSFNKKEYAYDMFHSRSYRLPGFYQDVSNASPTDCSDWTKKDKNRFRAAVFEHHENMKEVSKIIGKPIDQCITHYLVKFKRTKSYKSLKRSMKRKANASEGSAGILVCNKCSKGGMLIACDTCEAHYHLACAAPPLESIPDGTWNCCNCKRETRSMLSSQDEMSCGTDQNTTEGSAFFSAEGSSDIATEGEGDNVSMVGAGEDKRKTELVVDSAQAEAESGLDQTTGSSIHKRMRLDCASVPKNASIVA